MYYFSSLWRTRTIVSSLGFILLVLVMLAPLAACDSASPAPNGISNSGNVTNLTFWSWVPNQQTSVDLFNKTHPNIHVNWISVPTGANGTYAKMFTAIRANTAPDLGQIEYQFLPTFEATGGLLDLSQYGAASLKSDFVPWTWSQVTQGNAVYAIPQDTGPMAMFYRADLFKKYNIPVPTTWAQYANDAAKLHSADPQAYITDFPPKEAGQFIGYIWQAGGRWFHINGQSWQVGINDANSMRVANYWQNLLDKKLVKTDPDFTQAWYHDLQAGQVATWISAVWGANTILSNAPKTSGDWMVAPMPQWSAGQNLAGNWGGSTTVAFKNSKHPKAATEFAEWLNTNQQSVQDMVTGAQLYPALSSSLNSLQPSSAVTTFYSGQNIFDVFQTAVNNVAVTFQWGPTMNQVFTEQGNDFSNAVNGKMTLGAALTQLQNSTLLDMKNIGFSVQNKTSTTP